MESFMKRLSGKLDRTFIDAVKTGCSEEEGKETGLGRVSHVWSRSG